MGEDEGGIFKSLYTNVTNHVYEALSFFCPPPPTLFLSKNKHSSILIFNMYKIKVTKIERAWFYVMILLVAICSLSNNSDDNSNIIVL